MENYREFGIKTWFAFGTIYTAICAIAYLSGFWSQFNVDIFPYLTITDVFKYTFSPLFYFIPIAAFIALAVIAISSKERNTPHQLTILETITLAVFTIGSLVMGYYLRSYIIGLGIPLATAFSAWMILTNKPLKHVSLLPILALIALGTMDYGKGQAKSIIRNENYQYTTLKMNGTDKKLKLIGYINNHYFFIDTKNENRFIIQDLDRLTLRKSVNGNDA